MDVEEIMSDTDRPNMMRLVGEERRAGEVSIMYIMAEEEVMDMEPEMRGASSPKRDV